MTGDLDTERYRYGKAKKNQCPSSFGSLEGVEERKYKPRFEDCGGVGPVAASPKEEEMTFDGAIVKEQGVTFGIMVVKTSVIDNAFARDRALDGARGVFGGIPTILMAQNSRGTPRYYGRRDIVRFMANVPLAAVPWRRLPDLRVSLSIGSVPVLPESRRWPRQRRR